MKRILALLALVSSPALAQSYPGQYSTTPPTLSDGQNSPLQVDGNGNLKISTSTVGSWIYAPPVGGIVNSTAGVTVKAAAGAGVRNYIKSLQLTADALGVATEFVIRDGAAGTVLARIKVNTGGIAGSGTTIFDPPLKGTANTLVEIATLTASVTGGAYANLQGNTGP